MSLPIASMVNGKQTFPKAEHFARKMKLPMVVNAEVKALYGYAKPELDRKAAALALNAAEIYCTSPAFEAAMAILEERVSALNY